MQPFHGCPSETNRGRATMVALETQKALRAVQRLPFCYLCGDTLLEDDITDGDHVPAKAAFNVRDREPALKLRTHKRCNAGMSVDDKKIGQLIALRRREKPPSARDQALKFMSQRDMVAVANLNIDSAVWRWIRGFHTALYREPLVGAQHSIRTPFPRADEVKGQLLLQPLLEQHQLVVATLKHNRAWNNVDRILTNRGQLRYECVWVLSDDGTTSFCMFGVDIYDWKELGSSTALIPARGCAGVYQKLDCGRPETAAVNRDSPIIVVNDCRLSFKTRLFALHDKTVCFVVSIAGQNQRFQWAPVSTHVLPRPMLHASDKPMQPSRAPRLQQIPLPRRRP
jgi:hypothetical protein